VAVDLTKLGDVFGTMTCDDSSAACDIKSTEMGGSGGFYGRYGAPALVEAASKRLRMLEEEKGINARSLLASDDFELSSDHRRVLEALRRELPTA
jgi:hypothetical protein